MVTGHSPHPHHSHRYYVVLATVIIGAILILLLINDEGNLALTGSSVGIEGDLIEETFLEEEPSSSQDWMAFQLSFDDIPAIDEKTSFQLMTLSFSDLATKIKINEEELELKDLDNVAMLIADFQGEINLDENSLSLNGKAEKVIVNGIKISTKGKMKIYFKGLVYNTLEISEIEIDSLKSKEGSGTLLVKEKLDYTLARDKLTARNFFGDLTIGTGNESLLNMHGQVSAVSVAGELDLTLS